MEEVYLDLWSTRRIRSGAADEYQRRLAALKEGNTLWVKLEYTSREVWTIHPPSDPIKG